MSRTSRRSRSAQKRTRRGAVVVVVGTLIVLGLGFAVVQMRARWSSPVAASAALAVGAPAPTIALPATTGGALSVAQLRGSKVVVYFFESDD